jgi:hypothetical protein
MGEFFHGRRKKLGVLTLIMASVFMVGWMRSLVVEDEVQLPTNRPTTYFIGSSDGSVFCSRFVEKKSPLPLIPALAGWSYETHPLPVGGVEDQLKEHCKKLGFGTVSVSEWCGFIEGKVDLDSPPLSCELRFWAIPYWLIVIPLTLLTAFLLLSSHPRNSQTKNTSTFEF